MGDHVSILDGHLAVPTASVEEKRSFLAIRRFHATINPFRGPRLRAIPVRFQLESFVIAVPV
jgi:hypothetical protein